MQSTYKFLPLVIVYLSLQSDFKMKNMETLSKDDRYWIEYMNMIIFEFARSFKMPVKKAYTYLNQYGGIDFLNEFYDVEHTENPLYM